MILLCIILFDNGFAAQSLIFCDDFYANSIILVSEDDPDISMHTQRCCVSGFKAHVVVGQPLQTCANQRNDTIQCASDVPNLLTGVYGILNCCPNITTSFYLGDGIYPCSTFLIFPAFAANALVRYCPSSSSSRTSTTSTLMLSDTPTTMLMQSEADILTTTLMQSEISPSTSMHSDMPTTMLKQSEFETPPTTSSEAPTDALAIVQSENPTMNNNGIIFKFSYLMLLCAVVIGTVVNY